MQLYKQILCTLYPIFTSGGILPNDSVVLQPIIDIDTIHWS